MRSGFAVALATACLIGGAGAALAETAAPRIKAKPWLGVSISDRDAMWGGVAVVDVFDDTPASMCGLRAGDEILTVDAVDVRGSTELQNAVGAHGVGDKIAVQYIRGGDIHRCKTKLVEQITDPSELLHRRLVDKAAPTFSVVRRSDGAVIDDASVRGRVTVLALFSTGCDQCATTITDLAAAVGDQAGVDLLAVSSDGDSAIDAFVQRTGLTVDIGAETESDLMLGGRAGTGQLIRRYLQDRGDATILVIDHKGVVRFAASGAGPDASYLDGAAFCVSRAERARVKSK